jgi:predicted NAD/FAD-binding protein
MRMAVVGSGIAGLASAWLLSRKYDVTLFEANSYFGGHTHTHDVEQQGRRYRIDSGFIVHNPSHYPLLTRMFRELDVASQPTTMSFSVHSEANGLEYNAASLATLFCQWRNLCSPRFIGMVCDLMRFYREAPALLNSLEDGPTLGDYLAGPNHVLPTGGSARFFSPLGTYHFVKRTSVVRGSAAALRRLAPAVETLAELEGYQAHAAAIRVRFSRP